MLDRLHFGTAFPLKEMSSSKSTNAWFATGGVVPLQTWVLLLHEAGSAASAVAVRTWIVAMTRFFFGSFTGEISPVIVCLALRVAPKATPATPTQSVSASAPNRALRFCIFPPCLPPCPLGQPPRQALTPSPLPGIGYSETTGRPARAQRWCRRFTLQRSVSNASPWLG